MARNQILLNLRNRKIIERYYYYTEVKRRRFDDVLQILSEEEFFVSPSTIEEVLKSSYWSAELNKLIASKKTVKKTLFA